jgi:cytochrome b6-f complex iron-sulfur subunit
MKLKDSLFSRRTFLDSLIGGGIAALAGLFVGPAAKFVFPPYKEPDEVKLPAADGEGLGPGQAKSFAWGNKPALLKRAEDGTLQAFVTVCTHLDCNVTYLPDQRKFYCACHQGWYDENGINIAGPPPRPLRRLAVTVEDDTLVIKKQA